MSAYLKNEKTYRKLVREFVAQKIDAETFTKKFMTQWKNDRDHQWAEIENGEKPSEKESEFCEILDQIFTACDCYESEPEEKHEIDYGQLLSEVSQLTSKRWSF